MAVEAREVVFRGHVQGVGFRFTARDIARRFAVVGTVENREDGSVLLVAQGEPAELDAFIAAIEERMTDHIRTTDTRPRPLGRFTGFEIRH